MQIEIGKECERIVPLGNEHRNIFYIENYDEIIFKKILKEKMIKVLDIFKPLEILIIKMKFGIDGQEEFSFENISNYLKISIDKVKDIYENVLEKLRQPIFNLKEFV